MYQRNRSWRQYEKASSSACGRTKYSISISSNSRTRKTKLPGVISLRNALPCCAMPNGTRTRLEEITFLKSTNIPCAVSGRRYTSDARSSRGPTWVLNIRLNIRASSSGPPHSGHFSPNTLSARHRFLHSPRHWRRGSTKFCRWPEASHTASGIISVDSRPTTSSRSSTMWRHHKSLIARFSATPYGP